jgi:hypothetical protein
VASITIDSVLLSLGTDLATHLDLDVYDISDDDGVYGEVRKYAGGRRRAISEAGQVRSVQITFDVHNDRALVATLRSWAGQRLLYRDAHGRRMWCVFFRAPAKERILANLPEITLTLQEITFDEAV